MRRGEWTTLLWAESDVLIFGRALAEQRWHDVVTVHGGPLLQGFEVDDAEEFASWLACERGSVNEGWRRACHAVIRQAGAAGTPRQQRSLRDRSGAGDRCTGRADAARGRPLDHVVGSCGCWQEYARGCARRRVGGGVRRRRVRGPARGGGRRGRGGVGGGARGRGHGAAGRLRRPAGGAGTRSAASAAGARWVRGASGRGRDRGCPRAARHAVARPGDVACAPAVVDGARGRGAPARHPRDR